MPRRKLKDLNLLDDFLFGTIAAHPRWGEPFSRILLETIFRKKFGKLRAVPQKVYYGRDTDLHGTRLDVYFEELPKKDGAGETSIYDLEPDRKIRDLEILSRRTRFYHALIDGDSLRSGAEYSTLKNVMVVFIMSSDPFGAGRMVYTVRSICLEEPELPYNDGAYTYYLYTKGTKGDPPEALRQLLRYMENSVKENVVNEDLEQLHHMVESVKQDRKVGLSYMKSWEWEWMIREEVREEERKNTERERERAEQAQQRVRQMEEELAELREQLRQYKKEALS